MSKTEVDVKKAKKKSDDSLSLTVSNIQVIDHQIIITGKNLFQVDDFNIKDGNNVTGMQIESQTETKIVANTLSNVTFAAGKILDFILSSAQASSTFTVNFSLCDSTLGGKSINCSIIPNDKEVLSYDAASGKWKPKAVNGLSYQGSWDALHDSIPTTTTVGDYFIVSVASGVYHVGDWIVFNGSGYDRIDNSQMITNVFGRTGAVTAQEGDYNLTKLADVTITSPQTDDVLIYNGTTWVNGPAAYIETDPNVSAFAKTALPTCGAGQVLKSNGTSLSCVTDNSGAGAFTGTPNRALMTDALGEISITNVTSTELGYLTGVTSNIQTQLNAKLSAFTESDPSVSAFAKAALPTCGVGEVLKSNGTSLSCVTDSSGAGSYTGTQNRAVLTDGATGELTTSNVTSTEVGYLSGVTSAIQTQLNAKQATLATTTALDVGSVQTHLQNAVAINPYNTAAGNTGEFRFYELVANGTNYTGFKSPDNLTSNILYVMPETAPTAGQVLSSSASNVLSWIDIPSAPVTSVNTKTGAVVLTTSDIAEGTNLYFTNAKVLGVPLTGFVTTDSTAITASDSILVGMGKAQAQINNKLSSGTFIPWDMTGLQTIHPARLNLTLASASKALVTDASGFIVASGVTATEQGYLAGVTSSIQTQLNAKLSSFTETDPGVSAFAKTALPTCGTGEVLKGNGTSLSCVTDVSGAGSYTGTQNRVVVTDGATGELTTSSVTTTELGYLAGVTSAIQTQLNGKQATLATTTALDVGSVQTHLQNAVAINPYNTAAGNTGEFRFYELVANGTNYTGFKSPDNLTANILYVMPGTAPTAGQVLSSSATNVLSWIDIPSSPISSVNTKTGAVVLTTSDIAEGTNLYHTDAKVLATPITAPTLTNSAIATSDTLQVSLGKLQAQINNKEGSLATGGTTLQYYRGDKTLATLNTSIVPEVTNLYYTDVRVRAAPLTGFVTTDSTAIVAADTLLVGVGKAQAQLNNKLNSASFIQWDTSGVQTIHSSRLTLGLANASKAMVTDASGLMTASAVTATELGYVSGVTSSIQTQLNAKQGALTTGSVTSTHILDGTIADADLAGSISQSKITNLTTDLAAKQTAANLGTDVRAVVLTGVAFATNSAIVAADTILAAFGKLQAQITSLGSTKLDKAGGTLTVGTIDGVPTPTASGQIVNKGYVDTNTVANAGGAASVQIGALTSRPAAAAGNTGRMYVANDSGNEAVYVSTGSTWIKVASNGISGTIDDTTAAGATIVKRGSGGEVYAQYLVPKTTVTESATCTADIGTIAKDANGNLLTCQ